MLRFVGERNGWVCKEKCITLTKGCLRDEIWCEISRCGKGWCNEVGRVAKSKVRHKERERRRRGRWQTQLLAHYGVQSFTSGIPLTLSLSYSLSHRVLFPHWFRPRGSLCHSLPLCSSSSCWIMHVNHLAPLIHCKHSTCKSVLQNFICIHMELFGTQDTSYFILLPLSQSLLSHLCMHKVSAG